MSSRARPYAAVNRYAVRRPTFIPRPAVVGPRPAAGGGLNGIIGGLACPLLCLGCLAALSLLGLFATMIAAAAYMNQIQSQIRKNASGNGTTMELNIMVLFSAILCSIYVLTKHRRGSAIST
ncbi:unnamed protein product [Adineta steineri]|uniref:Uncharacterized protein n=1 Tax=Adineta steineri TaxID=433720 RepID=A0A815G9W9_9BILA|nr:unnamed protein product [Adineta steineri]CAF1177968.1 unnamed protein product [Adineta steineri]CAF1207214.1 unnamed protein product [Adineta steineri]CAF1335824.1 unnamed protein product [Adineta steineri]CAF1482661.1 unnamed protein product [Adineta steineri]